MLILIRKMVAVVLFGFALLASVETRTMHSNSALCELRSVRVEALLYERVRDEAVMRVRRRAPLVIVGDVAGAGNQVRITPARAMVGHGVCCTSYSVRSGDVLCVRSRLQAVPAASFSSHMVDMR